MSLESHLYSQIVKESKKLIDRHNAYHNHLHLSWLRNSKRISDAPIKEIKTPTEWSIDLKFNPFYVRKNARAIARSIAKKINDGTFIPNPPHQKLIPKQNGGERSVAVYQIPDAAVSTYFYSRLLTKNRHRFSAFSYAYRNDRNVHFAIQDISIDLTQNARTFIAEFDFSDFFGSIDHHYLFAQLHENGFLVSREDEKVIRAFLADRERHSSRNIHIIIFGKSCLLET